MSEGFDPTVFSQMQAGRPYATYKKTILGKVHITVIDPFTRQPIGMLLSGTKDSDTEFVDVWSEMENLFFKRANKKHLESGVIIKVERQEKISEPTIEQFSDEELRGVINRPYLAFQKVLSGITTEAVVYRMLTLAQEMEKSAKIVGAIEAKLADLQRKPAQLEVN